MSYLRTPRVIAVLFVFILSGAALALVLTLGLGRGPAVADGPVTGSTPTFTTAGDRWTLDEVLRRARAGEIDAISAMTPAGGTPRRPDTGPHRPDQRAVPSTPSDRRCRSPTPSTCSAPRATPRS